MSGAPCLRLGVCHLCRCRGDRLYPSHGHDDGLVTSLEGFQRMKGLDGCRSLIYILCQEPSDEGPGAGGDLVRESRIRGLAVVHFVHDGRDVSIALVVRLPREAKQEHDAHGIKIGARFQRLTARLLRRHVSERTYHDRRSIWIDKKMTIGDFLIVIKDLYEPEVDQDGLPAAILALHEEDVLGLHVAMDGAERMQGCESIANLGQDRKRLFVGKRSPAFEIICERHPFEQGHDEIGDAMGEIAQDVGMLERLQRSYFS